MTSTARYLLDTNIVSEPLKPHPNRAVLNRISALDGEMAIASVVWHELVFGMERLPSSRRRDHIERYLVDVVAATLEILPYDRRAALWHGRERARLSSAGRTPTFADGQIASIAATRGLVVVTRNLDDFRCFLDLDVENWFT